MNHEDSITDEKTVLCLAMHRPDYLDAIASKISAADFYDLDLGKLFSLMVDRHEAGQPITPHALLPDCRPIFSNAAATLGELVQFCPDSGHLAYHVGRIAEAARMRRLKILLGDCLAGIESGSLGLPEAEQQLDAGLSEARERGATQSAIAYDAGLELIGELDAASEGQPIHTGIGKVDHRAGGLMPGETMVIAARPGGGKSTLAMQIAKYNAERDRPALFVSLEMRRQELIARTLCGIAEVDGQQLRQGSVSQPIKQALLDATRQLDGVPLFIADPVSATLKQIRALARLQQAKTGLDLLVVDYLRLVRPANSRIDRRLQVAEVTAGLKRLAKELQITVIMLCQLNRAADREEPMLSNLAESAAVEQDADVVVFIQEDPECWRLIYAKHRHGRPGNYYVDFDRRRFEFVEAEPPMPASGGK